MRWHATVATMESTQGEIEQKIAHMADQNPDVIGWVEGVNEPNEGDGWVEPCVEIQRWIHDAVRARSELDHVVVLGPSMHDVRLANAGGDHWQQLADAGLADVMDVCAVHNYPGASTPASKRDERVQWVYDSFGDDYPIKFSEWGYTNTLGQPVSARTGRAKTISAEASAAYDCQACSTSPTTAGSCCATSSSTTPIRTTWPPSRTSGCGPSSQSRATRT